MSHSPQLLCVRHASVQIRGIKSVKKQMSCHFRTDTLFIDSSYSKHNQTRTAVFEHHVQLCCSVIDRKHESFMSIIPRDDKC